jgi:hypothetical protein
VEHILGRAARFIFCSRYTVLMDELNKLTGETTTLIISCLSGIVTNLMSLPDVKTGLEKTMNSIGLMLLEISRSNQRMRIIAVHCTPRDLADYETHTNFAMVIIMR